MIKIEDIILWIIIALIVTTALWLLTGSPPEIDALISISLFVAASELLIWKKLFSIEKNTEISFMKLKSDINEVKNKLEDGSRN